MKNWTTRKNIIIAIILLIAAVAVYVTLEIRQEAENQIVNTPQQELGELIATANYVCDGDRSITAEYYEGVGGDDSVEPDQPPKPTGKVIVSIGDSASTTLSQTISASGVRYVNDDESLVFWNKGNEVTIMRGDSVDTDYSNCVEIE